ncbi:MAG TPA: SAM-dependent methyltransferase [Thermoanaerobaculia bacterium]|nr:SAM-dependent methyltransferase [Thermoanaerobaculia bacterium]
MSSAGPMRTVLRKMLQGNDLSFRDFVEVALYHPEFGYYAKQARPEADYITSPRLSQLFSETLTGLIGEFSSRVGDAVSTVVDVGCGDGSLILNMSSRVPSSGVRWFGVDRSLERLRPEASANPDLHFVRTIDEVSRDGAHLVIANELFDALPFARLVQRDEHLHELWVSDRSGELDWSEYEAPGPYEDYFASRGIALQDGQFADISLEWDAYYRDLCRFVQRGMIVVFDYGFPQEKLFHARVRRFGTAASYHAHRVTRDLLANPGEQDITAHINFTDLIRAGEESGFTTLYFDRQAKFLLSLGAADNPMLREESASLEALARKEDARRRV